MYAAFGVVAVHASPGNAISATLIHCEGGAAEWATVDVEVVDLYHGLHFGHLLEVVVVDVVDVEAVGLHVTD